MDVCAFGGVVTIRDWQYEIYTGLACPQSELCVLFVEAITIPCPGS